MARRFALEGAAVALIGRDAGRGNAVAQSIRDGGGEAVFVRADLAVEDQARRGVADSAAALGGLDILVNNAAPTDLVTTGEDRPLEDLPTESFERILKNSLFSTFWCCKFAIPFLRDSGRASIINVSSIAALEGQPAVPGYTAGKAAVTALTPQLAVDYAKDGIRVNTLLFGVIDNERFQSMPVPGMREAVLKDQLTRFVLVEDCANAALFLASDQSACITGQMLILDGGARAKGKVPLDAITELGRALQPSTTT